MDDNEALAVAHMVLDYVERLQNDKVVPDIPEPFAGDAKFGEYQKKIVALRDALNDISRGNLSTFITVKGYLAACYKSLQANLRHLMWKVNQVQAGDYEHNLDFLGDISVSFNDMIIRLKTTIEALAQKEEALTELAVSLQNEAKKRSEVLEKLKKSEQKFKYLAQHDPLTNLLNRRSFFSLAEMSMESAASTNETCCVCLLDVDHFKKFNDTYGHPEGDRALQHVAKCGYNALRQSDIMGRYGGEEFIFLLTGVGMEYCFIAAERIRLAVENNPFYLENGDTVNITASVGVAVIPPDKEIIDYAKKLRQAIARADSALYEAKTQGRNRVCIAPQVSGESPATTPLV